MGAAKASRVLFMPWMISRILALVLRRVGVNVEVPLAGRLGNSFHVAEHAQQTGAELIDPLGGEDLLPGSFSMTTEKSPSA